MVNVKTSLKREKCSSCFSEVDILSVEISGFDIDTVYHENKFCLCSVCALSLSDELREMQGE